MDYKILLSSLALVTTVWCSNEWSQEQVSPKKYISTANTSTSTEEQKVRFIQAINEVLEKEHKLINEHVTCNILLQSNIEKQLVQSSLICNQEEIVSKKEQDKHAEDYIAGIQEIPVSNWKLTFYQSCYRMLKLYKEKWKVIRIEDIESADCQKK